jgi:hypothetical protein
MMVLDRECHMAYPAGCQRGLETLPDEKAHSTAIGRQNVGLQPIKSQVLREIDEAFEQKSAYAFALMSVNDT